MFKISKFLFYIGVCASTIIITSYTCNFLCQIRNNENKYYSNNKTVTFTIDSKSAELAASIFFLGIYQSAYGLENNQAGIFTKEDLLREAFDVTDPNHDESIVAITKAENDLIATFSPDIKALYSVESDTIPYIKFTGTDHSKAIKWVVNDDPTDSNWISCLYTYFSGLSPSKDTTVNFHPFLWTSSLATPVNLFTQLGYLGDGMSYNGQTIKDMSNMSINVIPTDNNIGIIENKEFQLFSNQQNITSMYYFIYYHTSDYLLNKYIIDYSPIFTEYFNRALDLFMTTPGLVWNSKIAYLMGVFADSIQNPIGIPKYNTENSYLFCNELFKTYFPFLTPKTSSELNNIFILNFYPSSYNIFERTGLTNEFNTLFLNPKVGPQSAEDIWSHFDLITNDNEHPKGKCFLHMMSSINITAIGYLSKLISLTDGELRQGLSSFYDVILHNDYLWKISDEPLSQKIDNNSAQTFELIQRNSQIIFHLSTDYLFDHGKNIPNDPWGVHVNPIRGSNIVFFILLFLIVIMLIGYLSINYYLIHKQSLIYRLDDKNTINSKKKLKGHIKRNY